MPRRPPRPYHHGDLPRALREAALDLTSEIGPDGVTLREVARRIGVSHTAPYRHYPDKRALFTALAVEAVTLLADALEAALQSAGPDFRARFLAAAYAYVKFAADHRAHFRIAFFSSDVDHSGAELRSASERSWGILLQYIAEAQAAGFFAPGDPLEIASAVWAMHHGLASLASVSGLEKLGGARAVSDAAHARLLDGLLAKEARSTPGKAPPNRAPPRRKT